MVLRLDTYLLKLRNRHFFLIDALSFVLIPFLALSLRLDGFVDPSFYYPSLLMAMILFMAVKLTVLLLFGFYRHYWQYAGVDELLLVSGVMTAAVIVQTFLFFILGIPFNEGTQLLPRSLPIIDGLLSLLFVGGIRFSVRAMDRASQRRQSRGRCDRTLIVGAGHVGASLALELQHNPHLGLSPIAFVDDDPNKINHRIRNLPVVGECSRIPEIVSAWGIRKVIIAMPSAPGKVIRRIVQTCQQLGVETNILPGMHEILNTNVPLGKRLREVRIEDLLRREPIQTDIEQVSHLIQGKRVLITGAGGSIGSELCRQICQCGPAEMVLLGHGENSVFKIQQELEQLCTALPQRWEHPISPPRLFPFIADLRHPSRLSCAFEQFQPEIVFHAAAHKHVPLMEDNSPEAITNNVFGTQQLLNLALESNVERFVMISTDKAVNPTSVMGASKRVAEMLVLKAAHQSRKPFVVVRFGNVLGSRGSVIPTFKKQIEAGGPVTVTHPEMCRYFMTIPESVQLVLQAAALSPGGEVLMLNMGEPVKIVDLAKDLIYLSGYELGKDIDIHFTGPRPGEKLFEELFIPGEKYEPRHHEKLFVVQNASSFIPENLDYGVNALHQAASNNDDNAVRVILSQLVPGYTPSTQTATRALVNQG